jgi:hypothetical protein
MENGLASSIGEQNANRFLCNAKLCKKGAWRNARLNQTRRRHKKCIVRALAENQRLGPMQNKRESQKAKKKKVERVGNPMRRKEDAKTNMVRGGTAIPKTDKTYEPTDL